MTDSTNVNLTIHFHDPNQDSEHRDEAAQKLTFYFVLSRPVAAGTYEAIFQSGGG